MQFLGPSQNVTSPLHPWGSSDGGGTPPGTIHRSGTNSLAFSPHTCGLMFIVMNGTWKTYSAGQLVQCQTKQWQKCTHLAGFDAQRGGCPAVRQTHGLRQRDYIIAQGHTFCLRGRRVETEPIMVVRHRQ